MEPTDVLTTLTALGCQVSAEGDTLRILDPHHALTDALRQQIHTHKAVLLAMLAPSVPDHAADTELSPQEVCTHQAHVPPSPPPYPGHPVGAPFRPGHQVWLYRWDTQTPRFDAPVTIVQLRTLPTGEQDIGWCNTTGEVTWHNARLAVAVETPEVHRHP